MRSIVNQARLRVLLWLSGRLSYAQAMLPILRLIPVGGVSLAIVLLLLALHAPGDSRPPLPHGVMPARGPLIASGNHPEWRRWFFNAALRRAEELRQLRELPDAPARAELTPEKNEKPEKESELAGVPSDRRDADPEDVTGTVVQSPDASIPVDIGETSSTELPVTSKEDLPPVIKMPEQRKPPQESLNIVLPPSRPAQGASTVIPEPAQPARDARKKSARSARHARAAAASQQIDPLQGFFGGFTVNQPTAKPRR
jgi:hypothetical protein